jgi:hypothetical protein
MYSCKFSNVFFLEINKRKFLKEIYFDQIKSHKKKIFMAQQQEKEVVRTGMDFVAQGRT